MDKTKINISKLGEEPNDVEYWRTKPYAERLEALESLRQQFYNYTDETSPRLQRVYRIIERKQG